MRTLVTTLLVAGLLAGALPAAPAGLVRLRGSLHDHTAEGGDDGQGSVADALAAGRAAGFDFFALTPHNHMIEDATYASLREQVAAAEVPGEFLPLAGYEWGTISKGGHVGVFGAEAVSRATGKEWERFYTEMDADPGDPLLVLNHPVWNREFGGTPDPARDRRAALVEVLGGPSHHEDDEHAASPRPDLFHQDVLVMLNQGWRAGFSYGEDDHTGSWGQVTRACMGAWARGHDRTSLLEALRARRTYASEDRELDIWLEVGGVAMGGEAPLAAAAVHVRATHASEEVADVAVFFDPDGPGGEPAKVLRQVEGGEANLPLEPDAPGAYVLAVARTTSGARAWASPVWFGPAPEYLPPPPMRGEGKKEWDGQAMDLNFASAGALRQIPGLGKGTSKRIEAARDAGALFLRVEELRTKTDLPEDTLARILPHLRVGTARDTADYLSYCLRKLRGLTLSMGKKRWLEGNTGRAERLLDLQLEALLARGKDDRVCHALAELDPTDLTQADARERVRGALSRPVDCR